MTQRKNYVQRLQHNIETLEALGTRYPSLGQYLAAYGEAKLRKLKNLHEYFISYEAMPSYDDTFGRGMEMMASQGYLMYKYGGDRSTWASTIRAFCVLGLLRVYCPRAGKEGNTKPQEQSIKRAKEQGRKNAVRWYSVPRYTDKVLSIAEARAPIVQALGRGINKDAVRDSKLNLSIKEVNAIFDNGYEETSDTTENRQTLDNALLNAIRLNGYTYSDTVAEEAAQEREAKQRYFIYREWRSYRPIALEKHNLIYGRATKQEREQYNLPSGKWIIRRA